MLQQNHRFFTPPFFNLMFLNHKSSTLSGYFLSIQFLIFSSTNLHFTNFSCKILKLFSVGDNFKCVQLALVKLQLNIEIKTYISFPVSHSSPMPSPSESNYGERKELDQDMDQQCKQTRKCQLPRHSPYLFNRRHFSWWHVI